MSVEEENVYFLVFTVARVAGPKTGGGEGGKGEGNPQSPISFPFWISHSFRRCHAGYLSYYAPSEEQNSR